MDTDENADADTDHLDCDVVVLGATPGGIAAAVRAARAGQDVLLVAFNARLGGMMAGGLSVTDTTFEPTRARSPLLDEFFERVREHYRSEYGPDSGQYADCNEGLHFEPKVAEGVFEAMVGEAGVEVRREYHPTAANRAGRELRDVTFAPIDGGDGDEEAFVAGADAFVDATYEGDLAAVAGVDYRVGRESREEFGEQYAGRLFSEKGTRLFPGSTGVGDDAVQAYDYRLCLTSDPDERMEVERPPGYDREEFLPIVEDGDPGDGTAHRSEEVPCRLKSELVRPTLAEIEEMGLYSFLLFRGPLPNDKRDLNTADLPGLADDYPEAGWERRGEIARRHREHVLGLLYFLQHDEAVPEALREEASKWGLPADEFGDDGFPFQLYVREGRRIVGRETFTEHHARLAEGLDRSPVVDDAVAVAEYPMDSHDCRPVRRPGSLAEGHHFLGEVTVPSQVPYGALLPESLDNLLVPVPLSATHVGFGTIRLEPTWMQIGEVAGYAAALADERGTVPGRLDHRRLQRRLADEGGMLGFFDDVELDAGGAWIPAVQYLSTKGFFGDYEARPGAPLDRATAEQWAETAARLLAGEAEATARARALPEPDSGADEGGDADAAPVTGAAFRDRLAGAIERAQVGADADVDGALDVLGDEDAELSRGDACRVVYRLLA